MRQKGNATFSSLRLSVLTLLILGLTVSSVAAQGTNSAGKVKVTAKAGKADADGTQLVTITLDIAEKWHLYANPVGNEMLTGAQTSVKFTNKLDNLEVDYPAGKLVKDEAVGNYKTYEGKVTIKAKVKRAKGDSAPLELRIKVQACDDKSCLPPSTIKAKVE